jgi:dimethylamine/trimethylamine dehydrogenase
LSLFKGLEDGTAVLANLFTGEERRLPCASLVIVGARMARNELYDSLLQRQPDWAAAGIASVERIGDALAPGALAHSIHSAHRYARELDRDPNAPLYKRDAPISWSEPRLYVDGPQESGAA